MYRRGFFFGHVSAINEPTKETLYKVETMNIILLSKARKSPVNLQFSRFAVVSLVLFFFVAVPAGGVAVGYFAAQLTGNPPDWLARNVSGLGGATARPVEAVAQDARSAVDALTLRLGDLQARIIRLDALGKRLVENGKLDKREFNFEQPPAVGGPEDMSALESMDLPDFIAVLEQLTRHVDSREQELAVLDTLLFDKTLRESTMPNGRPLQSAGYISSNFGKRTDPFHGRVAFHSGVDFAGPEGAKVVSVASGVVTWSGEHFGYGNLVEVDHGNGYVTRYAHNKRNLAKVGDVVKKGQPLALMGSTGRSTGPHVHFELLRNGTAIDPTNYLRAAR